MSQEPPPQSAAESGFDPRRLRTVADLTRSSDDRMLAGVCGGAGRHLDIDPVIVRIVLGTLTIFGLAGVIVYVAAWLLVPEEPGPDGVARESIAKRTLHLGANEEQIRVLGLIAAVIIAIASAASMVGGAWHSPFPYVALAAVGGLWWLFVRPRQEAAPELTASSAHPTVGATVTSGVTAVPATPEGQQRWIYPPVPPRPRNPRHDGGRLTLISLCMAAMAVAGVWIYSIVRQPADAAIYPGAALGVIAAGTLVGSLVGNGRPLIPFGLVTALVLVVVAGLPSLTVGERTFAPVAASQVRDSYSLGVGRTELDLRDVTDVDALDGRTITIDQGVGEIDVALPVGLDVDLESSVRAGEIRALGRTRSGTRVSYDHDDPVDDGPRITLVLDQTVGEIEVTRP